VQLHTQLPPKLAGPQPMHTNNSPINVVVNEV